VGELGVRIIEDNLRRRNRHLRNWLRGLLCAVIAVLLAGGAVSAQQKKKAAAKKAPAKKAASSASAKKEAQAKANHEKAAGAFNAFCQEWMGKLATRERDNKAQIKWQTAASGTQGEYIGYSQEHTCQIKELTEPTGVPIGTITYRELRYQQSGTSQMEAVQSEPRVIEIVEVIEIFRFTNGKWVY
jgi:hypothetical protein